MSDPTTATVTEPPASTTTPPIPGPPPAHVETTPAELPGDHPLVKTLALQKAELKELRDKARRLDEFEESQKTEGQRLADAAAKAQRDAEEARAEITRYRVAATHGVTPDYFALLGSGDEAVIEANAQKVSSLLALGIENAQLKADIEALQAGKTPALTRPVADLKPGATPKAEPAPDTSYPASWLPQQRKSNN